MTYHIAQINVALALAPMDDPRMADFANALDKINALAEKSPGFVWRLKDDSGNATDFRITDIDNLLVNMSVWENIDALYQYAYKSHHVDYFSRRREWFTRWEKPSPVLWWVSVGHQPTLPEALARINYMHAHGPTPHAFDFKQRFTVDEMLAYTPA